MADRVRWRVAGALVAAAPFVALFAFGAVVEGWDVIVVVGVTLATFGLVIGGTILGAHLWIKGDR